jgi:hypothetical protein
MHPNNPHPLPPKCIVQFFMYQKKYKENFLLSNSGKIVNLKSNVLDFFYCDVYSQEFYNVKLGVEKGVKRVYIYYLAFFFCGWIA